MSRATVGSILLALLAVPLAHAGEGDTRLALRTSAALYQGIHTETLSNGLRVYLKPIPGAAAVTTMVVYKVGSADEDKSFTGLSHYLEHLMFKGTVKLKPGDIDRTTFRNGGSNNAYTNTDLTAYHFTFPAGRWRAALEIEADRMRNLRIDRAHEFDKEKGAVINELAMNEDQPWDLEYKAILPLLFGKKSPYGHPVIGEAQHVRDANEKVIKAHYDRWYHPDNAALLVVGGFDQTRLLAEIRKLFGPIPKAGKLPPRKPEVEHARNGPQRKEIKSKFAVPRLLLGYNTVRAGSADHVALNVLENVLAQGKRSRLYTALVEGAEVANSVSADHAPGRYAGWMSVGVELLPGQDRAAVEKKVLAELAKLRTDKISAAELARVQHQILANQVFNRETTMGLANALATATTVTSLEFARNYLPAVMAVTPDDVLRVARKYLDPNRRVTVWSVPPKKVGRRSAAARRTAAERRATFRADAAPVTFDLKKARREVLPNGLVVLLYENRRLPFVEAHLAVHEGILYERPGQEGVATLVGALLEEGTTTRTGAQIAEAIERVGGSLSMSGTSSSVKVLSPDRKLGLDLLFDCASRASFPRDAFARVKAQVLAQIAEAETQPETRARQRFYAAVYGKHPLGRPSFGTLASVKGLKREDCIPFHRAVFVPNNATLAIVGDFDSKEVLAEVKALTAHWKKSPIARPELPEVLKPPKFTQTVLSMPEAAQLHFFMGHVGVRRNNPDFYKLLVMDYILGTGPGFTDRLSARLRDREGLAYTVSANITRSAGKEPGAFTCYIGTDPDKFATVKRLFLEELKRIRDTEPSATELADAKAYLTGSRLLEFASNNGIAAQLLNIERYGLGFGYLDDFRKGVEAVTAADVQAVARKYLDPERMVLVASGPVDEKGRPLKGKR
jgi:zinc protease